MRVDIGPRRFESLSGRDRLLWARLFAREAGLQLEDVARFTVDDGEVHGDRHVRVFESEDRGEWILPVGWRSVPLMRRTVRRFTE